MSLHHQEQEADDLFPSSQDGNIDINMFPSGLLRQNSELVESTDTNNDSTPDGHHTSNGGSVQQLNSVIMDLKYQLQEKNSEIEGKDLKIEKLRKRVRELDEKVQEYAFFGVVDEDQQPDSNSRFTDSGQSAATSEEASSLREELDVKSKELFGLREKLEDKDAEIRKQKEEINQLKQVNEQARRDTPRRDTPSRSSRTSKLDSKIQVRLNETVGKCKELEKNLERAWREVDQYKQQCEELNTRMNQFLLDKKVMSEEQLQKFEQDRAQLQKELLALQENLDDKSHELEGEASKCRQYEEDLRSREVAWKRQREQLESTVSLRTTELHKLEESLHVTEENRVKLHSQVQVLLKEKSEEEEQKEHYKSVVTRLSEEKRTLEMQTAQVCTGFQKEAEEALLNYEQLRQKSESDSNEITKYQQRNREITKRLNDSLAEGRDLNAAMKELETSYRSLEAKKNQLEKDMEAKDKTITGLQDEMMAKQLSAETYQADFERESQVKNELGRRIRNLERELQKEKEANESLCAKMQSVASKNDSLSKSNRDLMEQLNSVAATQCLDAFGDTS